MISGLQRQYGKSPADLENYVDGFIWALSAYPVDTVLNALKKYVLTKADIPSPSEIVALIDPPKPIFKPNYSYYQKLVKLQQESGAYALNDEEVSYVQACEEYSKSQMGNAS